MVANDGIDLTVEPAEIHALLGENGAGKSTLMNILYGLLRPDDGEILIDGRPAESREPADAIRAGVGMVHQHFMLVPVFTVAENVMLGAEATRGGPFGLLDRRRARREVAEVSDRYGLAVDPDAVVADLPVGVQQRVEIVKALTRDVDLLILDEPTAALTPQETDELLGVMRSLKGAGKSVVFITLKLKEVTSIVDRVTVIRQGRTVITTDAAASEEELAALMVGRSVRWRAPAGRWSAVLVGAGVVAVVASFLCWQMSGSTVNVMPLGNVARSSVIFALPLIFGGLAGLLGERSGVINIAIEGQFIAGAFAAALVATVAASVWAGIAAAAVAGILVAAVLAVLAIRFLVDQIVAGVVLIVLATGLTGFLFEQTMAREQTRYNQPSRVPTWEIPGLAEVPVWGSSLSPP